MAEAAAWYDERVVGLGERFLSEAEAAFACIDETPLTGAPCARSPTRLCTFSSRDSSSLQSPMPAEGPVTGRNV
jgi:hypothetical protein